MDGLVGTGWRYGWLELPGGARLRTGERLPAGRPRGTVVLQSGRSEFLEKYAEQAADWAARGWRVVGWDWRGQGLSTKFLPNPQKGHVPDFDLFLDDTDIALAHLLPPGSPEPVVCFAHSMGAHIMTRYVAERRHPFRALMLSAPMLAIETGPLPAGFVAGLAWAACALGFRHAYAPGQIDYREEAHHFEGNVLTSDPRLILGGVTCGWLDAACRSMARLRRTPLDRVDIPVLVLSAGGDRVVRSAVHGDLARRLPRAVHKVYAGAEHELMMERDEIRERVWADLDAFLAEVLPEAAASAGAGAG